MSELDRKDFLKLTITVVGTACFAPACGEEDPAPTPATGGVANGGTPPMGGAGMSTGGTATGGTATGGTATGGTATGGTATGGAGGAGSSAGGAGGAGSSAGGAGGAGSGSGGAGSGGMAGGAAGSGGASAGAAGGGRGGNAGAGGGGGGMCMGPVMTDQTDETHVHSLTIMADQINSGMTMFAVGAGGMGNHTHMIVLTAGELMQLRMGMALTDKATAMDSTNHTHTYDIECA